MDCPNCGTPEGARVRICQSCGTAYASEDLLRLRELEFLLSEIEGWPGAAARRAAYIDELTALKSRLLWETEGQAGDSVWGQARASQQARDTAPSQPHPTSRTSREHLPFDQWLLSERNIKLALYSGAVLLLVAGAIFTSVNWVRIPGPGKFAISLLATGLMYLAGFTFYRRPDLRLGGIALLFLGAGFLPLNFVILQIYIFGPRGFTAEAMWLIGSLPTLLLYSLTAYWTRNHLFTYLSLVPILSALSSLLSLLDATPQAYVFSHAVLLLLLQLLVHLLQGTRLAGFTRVPILIAVNLGMPAVFLAATFLWMDGFGLTVPWRGNAWLALAAMLTGVIFYVASAVGLRWQKSQWAATFSLALIATLFFSKLEISDTAAGASLSLLAFLYLLAGRILEIRFRHRFSGWSLYAAAYVLGAFLTFKALIGAGEDPDHLANILIGDVALLLASAYIHRQIAWVYAATWLFIAPVYIYAWRHLLGRVEAGAALTFLMLNYGVAGYALSRRKRRLAGPFMTAASSLSLLIVPLSWANPPVAAATLSLIALLYLLGALWRNWAWLLLPSLAAMNLALLAALRTFLIIDSICQPVVAISNAGLGTALCLGGVWLRKRAHAEWSWPLLLIGTLDLAASYALGLILGGSVAIALSIAFALLSLAVAWVEQESFAGLGIPPLPTYLAAALLFTGHFYLLDSSFRAENTWPALTAGLCAFLGGLGILLHSAPISHVYATPLRRAGHLLMLIPLGGAVAISSPALIAMTFGIAAILYGINAAAQRSARLAYLSAGMLVVVILAVLRLMDVTELQAYAFPLGTGLLLIGEIERRHGHRPLHLIPMLLGSLILMLSALYQSLDEASYALLLLTESLVSIGWGIRYRSRIHVSIGGLALFANALVELGPAFVSLPRWIQLGITGSLLLSGGLVALIQRQRLLEAHRRLADRWRCWEP